jgi:hypothetical protein
VSPESAAAGRSGQDRLAREIHPSVPQGWVKRALAVSRALERVPLVREIAGSLLMRGRRA